MSAACDVAVVGAGPVGLLLASLLIQRGLHVRVLERRTERSRHARAIGVHPPGLRVLAQVECAAPLVACGVKVRRGHALARRSMLGAISFETLTPPYDFVLSVPQRDTERLLQQRLEALDPDALTLDCAVQDIVQSPDACRIDTLRAGRPETLTARVVVGCDGKQSVVRRVLGASFRGRPYREHFLMGDCPDHSTYGDEAAVFFDTAGLVESFPLPGQRRRWVVGTRAVAMAADARLLSQLVRTRTGAQIAAPELSGVSAFVAERYRASCFARGRLALAGDAAHVLSPIGGQGMNLGWLDAEALAESLDRGVRDPRSLPALLARYDRQRRRAARLAAMRAELYMAIGCPGSLLLGLRARLVEALLRPPLAPHAARFFTMQTM